MIPIGHPWRMFGEINTCFATFIRFLSYHPFHSLQTIYIKHSCRFNYHLSEINEKRAAWLSIVATLDSLCFISNLPILNEWLSQVWSKANSVCNVKQNHRSIKSMFFFYELSAFYLNRYFQNDENYTMFTTIMQNHWTMNLKNKVAQNYFDIINWSHDNSEPPYSCETDYLNHDWWKSVKNVQDVIQIRRTMKYRSL